MDYVTTTSFSIAPPFFALVLLLWCSIRPHRPSLARLEAYHSQRGIIFHGPPGNGKTISIKALMKTLSNRPQPVACLYVKSFTRYDPEYGMSAVFKKARETAPCLLIFEDVDSLVTPSTRSYFLNEVDGLEKNDGVCMVGSTNYRELPFPPSL